MIINTLDIEVVAPLKYMCNFWRFLNLLLINGEIELDLSWQKECITSEMSITPRVAWNPNANSHVQAKVAIQITGVTFQINNAKLYVTVATLSINDNKQGSKITISWNEHRSEKRAQPRNNKFRLSDWSNI